MTRRVDFLIVPAGPGDAGDLARLHIATWRETYAGILPRAYLEAMDAAVHARRWRGQLTRARAGEVVLLAETARGPVGYCAGHALGEEAEVFTLYVLEAFQAAGVGRRLLGSAARIFAAAGARRLALSVLSENVRARGFYEHLGGRRGDRRTLPAWGGVEESVYRWDDIAILAGGAAEAG